jgi:hypothetical protein
MIYLIGYQVGDGWHVKIGIAVYPQRRLWQLQTGNPNYLSLLKTIPARSPRDTERRLHQMMRHYRWCSAPSSGRTPVQNEWFVMGDEGLAFLIAAMDRLALAQSMISVMLRS